MSPSPCTGSGRAQIRRSPAEYESAGLAVIERDAPDLPDHPARPPVASPASWLAARTACLDAPSDPIPHFRRSKCQLCTPRLRCGTSLFGDLGRESSGPRLAHRRSPGYPPVLHDFCTARSRPPHGPFSTSAEPRHRPADRPDLRRVVTGAWFSIRSLTPEEASAEFAPSDIVAAQGLRTTFLAPSGKSQVVPSFSTTRITPSTDSPHVVHTDGLHCGPDRLAR